MPIELDTTVWSNRFDGVVFFERSYKMLGVLIAHIFDSKVVDDECEGNWSGVMSP
jgi:DMSO/TMAO reductase YedYZ molybdopterin-dependent catalytic subunit